MELIDRYIYAVTRRLPEKQREDIEKELRTLIDDMMEQHQGSEDYKETVQKVLLELGDPEVMANNYRSTKRYLIGPQNFDNYLLILKIVLGAVFLGLSIATIMNDIFTQNLELVSAFANYFGTLFSGLIEAFAWVTIIFAMAEFRGVDLKSMKQKEEPWTIAQLPMVPEKKAAISPWESIIGIIFSAVFMTILYFEPQLFAAYLNNGANGVTVIPVFDLNVLVAYRALFAVVFVLTVLKEVLKIVSGRWTLKLSITFSVLSIITTIIMAAIFINPAVWNPNFVVEVLKHNSIEVDFINVWGKLIAGFIAIMIAACILDVSKALYKGLKYNITK